MGRKKPERKELVAVEGNIMEMPFFTTKDNSPKPMNEEVIFWVTEDRGIRILPPPMGMPDSLDATVFLYLLWKATQEWQKTGIFPKKVHFTIREIGNIVNTGDKRRIRIAIDRLKATTYDFVQSFRKGGVYINKTVRLLDKGSYWTKESELPRQRAKDTTFVVFSKDIIDSIVSGYYRYLDFQKHQKLKRPLARRLHFLLAKRLGENREIQIGFKKLAQAIPLQTYIKHKKKKAALKYLIPAIEELVKAEILTYEYDKERDVFIFRQPEVKLTSMDAEDELKNYLIGELRALWLTDSIIKELMKEKDWDLIAGVLEYIEKQKPQNPTGFFLKVVDDGNLPEALKDWSKKRTYEVVKRQGNALFPEDRKFVKEFLEEFKERFPNLKDGFLKNRFLRHKFEKAYKERQAAKELEKERTDPEVVRKEFEKAKEKLRRSSSEEVEGKR